MEEQKNINKEIRLFDALGPKRSFFFGVILIILVICTIGFFYLLISGNESGSTTKVFGSTNSKQDVVDSQQVDTLEQGSAVEIAQVTDDDRVLGDLSTADVVIVEYSDLECPFCKQFHPTMQQVVEEYDGTVAWVYRHFPLDSIHPKARKEAEATECAAEIGGNSAFWEYTDRLFELTPSNNAFDLNKLPDIAEEIGLDVSTFSECLDSGKYAGRVEEQYQGGVRAGVTGTPFSFIVSRDGTTVPLSGAQPLTTIKKSIDDQLL